VWVHFSYWGIWDWEYQESLLETARRTIVQYRELPLWNPFMGGGRTLIGHPLGRTFNPSFVPILLFGTIPGIKISIYLYLLLGQGGMYLLARNHGFDRPACFLATALFSFGGYFVHHVTHGHFEWLAYSWVPFVLLAVERSTRRLDVGTVLAGGGFLGLVFLDGGPYQVCFSLLFLGVYGALLALAHRSARPLMACYLFGMVAAALTAIHILPVAETFLATPRRTPETNRFYGMPVEPSAWEIVFQGFVSRRQGHDAEAWMPFVLNVGCYVGVVPILLAVWAMAKDPRRHWPLACALALAAWIYLGPAAPIDAWAGLHQLPGFSSLQVPARFKVFVLVPLALLAGAGLQALGSLDIGRTTARALCVAVALLVTADLFLVNLPTLKVAFSVPPVERGGQDRPPAFSHYWDSPYRAYYRDAPLYPLAQHNRPRPTFPAILDQVGVVNSRVDFQHPRNALSFDDPRYPGREAWASSAGTQITSIARTPNTITMGVEGEGGWITVNQNYARGWRVMGESGEIGSQGGLLSVDVPPGSRRVVLRFRPRSFEIGAAVSVVTLVIMAGLCLRGLFAAGGITAAGHPTALGQPGRWHAGAVTIGIALLALPILAAVTVRWRDRVSSESRASVHQQHGREFSRQGNWPQALGEYEQALQIAPESVVVLRELGDLHLQLQQYEQAETHYRRALQINGNDAVAHYGLAAALLRSGRYGEAVEHLRVVVHLSPEFTLARQQLEQLVQHHDPP
jgi:cytochrome c-type biogenesis protein CcmH/NrfG